MTFEEGQGELRKDYLLISDRRHYLIPRYAPTQEGQGRKKELGEEGKEGKKEGRNEGGKE